MGEKWRTAAAAALASSRRDSLSSAATDINDESWPAIVLKRGTPLSLCVLVFIVVVRPCSGARRRRPAEGGRGRAKKTPKSV